MNIKKISVILLLICFYFPRLFASACEIKYKKPKSYDSSKENIEKSDEMYDFDNRYTDILPNPIVYLYGKNTFDDPILLMTFSSTIPEEWLNGEKVSNLDAAVLKLKIPPLHGYYYKILKISADQILQTVAISTSSTTRSSVEGEGKFAPAGGGGSGSLKGKVEHVFNKSKAYDTIKPIITYSGVGSDTLTLMLKRGQEYPIPNGRINVYMLVRAIRDESNKIEDIFKKHYCNENFYDNNDSFKKELISLINEISGCKYENLEEFFNQLGISIDKSKGFQYKKVNAFIKTSVFLKYKNKRELKEALYEAELKDPTIKKLINDLISQTRGPNKFLNEVNQQEYTNINYKLSKNIIDFINSIKPESNDLNLKNAENFRKLINANKNEIKLMNNFNIHPNKINNLINNVNTNSGTIDTPKTSNDTDSDDFKFTDYNLYETAYKLKMRISAYNYAISRVCCPASDFDLSKYIKDIKGCTCKCQRKAEESKQYCQYKTVIDLNNKISIKEDSNGKTFDLGLQQSALDLIEEVFTSKNQQKRNIDEVFSVLGIDNLIYMISNPKICSWNDLKSNSYYMRKYYNAITLVDKIYAESINEHKIESSTNQDLIELIKNDNNVDLKFKKTIVQYKKNSFLNFEKDRIDRWCPPIISRVVLLPLGSLLWPLQLRDRRIEYHPTECAINTSKIIEGSDFDDKEHQKEDGYFKDDKDYIFKDMEGQIDLIKKERDNTNIKPTITDPHKTSFN